MKGFFPIFLLHLSCELSSGYFEIFPDSKFHIKKVINRENFTRLDIYCKNDEECQSFILNSKCLSNICKCTEGTVLSSDASKCLPVVEEYGSLCEDNVQCSDFLSAGGICNDNNCMCNTGYHYLKGSCWKNTALHERCFKDEQCFSAYEYIGLICESNTCKCRKNYYERLGSSCRRERKTYESCNLDEDCVDESTCEKMVCSKSDAVQITFSSTFSNRTLKRIEKYLHCPKGMFEFNNTCARELGMNCNEDLDCNHIKNAICLDNSICACEPAKYVASEDNRECLKVSLGKIEEIKFSSCKKDPQCGVFGENSFCQNRRCHCKSGTYFESKNKFCWKITPLNENCFDDRDCYPSGTYTECRKTKEGKFCVCKEGYHEKGSVCLINALEVGDTCLDDDDCMFPNSFCDDNNVCTCKENHYNENGKCIPGVESLCNSDADCNHLKNTECKVKDVPKKRCLCLETYTNSVDYKYCLPVKNFKEKCEESFQCKFPRGDQGVCNNSVCECRQGEHYLNEKCYKTKFIKEPCSSRSECFPGNDTNSVICLKGFCFCNYDYELEESRVCVKTNSAHAIKFYWMSLLSGLFFLTLRR